MLNAGSLISSVAFCQHIASHLDWIELGRTKTLQEWVNWKCPKKSKIIISKGVYCTRRRRQLTEFDRREYRFIFVFFFNYSAVVYHKMSKPRYPRTMLTLPVDLSIRAKAY